MRVPATMPEPPGAIFLSAICGTAMASLAGMLKESGYEVAGSDDAVYPPMSVFLRESGIPVFEGFSEANVRRTRPDLVIVGNTLSRGNPEVEYVLNEGIRYASMAETVKELFIRGRRSIVVSGTHGKTTTTAMVAWMLEAAGRSPSVLVGGMTGNFGRGYKLGTGPEFVIEGDEYDTAFFDKGPKFLHYLPNIALVNNIEFDHADIYPDLESIRRAFRRMMNIVPGNGLIVAGTDSPGVGDLLGGLHARVASFGVGSGEWRAGNMAAEGGGTAFDVIREGRFWRRFTMPLIGEFNVRNALGAMIAADEIGLTPDAIQEGLRSFKGVRRRLEVVGQARGVTVYDDLAHHPTEVEETLRAVRARFPEARVWAVFEPRSQTARRRVFEDRFAAALGGADVAVIAAPFRTAHLAAEDVIRPGAMVERIREGGGRAHAFDSAGEIVEFVSGEAGPGDRVVVMSNGGFENVHRRILDALDGERHD